MNDCKSKNFRDLRVWQKSLELTKRVYELTGRFPTQEKFGLVTQLRRAAVSVPSNIAEGQARRKNREFVQFVSYAQGSVAEIETQLVLSVELGFCRAEDAALALDAVVQIKRMLTGLRRELSKNNSRK